ncbi:RagB/SusD family nutrient uptake outer membrane protein [Algoriphagus chordae]|uniref:Putative outer membrane starch-binding protein n=1 Tax=Algoriphagus chordae TaxID=237019 RepID=A0A2W7QN32_9BACT|nr:RagB/SusD family nutrient uptake outer membrane protein [Algoriphagus chordae]PZX49898.1 putative outer membrane starch-binding protein [Algoriphagus chordae]
MKKITIKNIKLALVAAALVGFSSSCDVTDLTPANLIPDDEAFTTAARIESTVLGVYESAQRGYYGGAVQRGYPFGAANVEQGDLRGEDMYNDQLFYEITYVGSYNPNSANNNGMWISLYRMINRLNIILGNLDEAVSSGVLTTEQGNGYKGELLFLRALAHHELLVHFARPYSDDPNALGVPYRTFGVDDVTKVPEAEAVGRGTVGADYTQLLTDLDQAEGLIAAGGAFRANKGAVIALKSRIKLHMEDWTGVLAEYEKLKAMTYALTPNPVTPFRGGTSSDNIFSFVNSAEANPGVNGALPSMYGNPDLGARGLVKISPVIWTAAFWKETDARRVAMTTKSATGVFTDKYTDATTYTDPNVILRYAEVVLNASEAYARTGKMAEAVVLLNSVRSRALPASEAEYTVSGLGDGILEAIWNERRIEFLAEGRRWPDIHRLSGSGEMEGVPSKASSRSITSIDFYTGAKPIPMDHSIAYSSTTFIWPIPLTELQTNSTAPIEQNPGY